ncbi:hypothetical protein B0H11DRAFT_2198133 [Mycena galericulata]|nr:hypothetical protein B0H11DRAFT_2198133 [Mycena galericulata]
MDLEEDQTWDSLRHNERVPNGANSGMQAKGNHVQECWLKFGRKYGEVGRRAERREKRGWWFGKTRTTIAPHSAKKTGLVLNRIRGTKLQLRMIEQQVPNVREEKNNLETCKQLTWAEEWMDYGTTVRALSEALVWKRQNHAIQYCTQWEHRAGFWWAIMRNGEQPPMQAIPGLFAVADVLMHLLFRRVKNTRYTTARSDSTEGGNYEELRTRQNYVIRYRTEWQQHRCVKITRYDTAHSGSIEGGGDCEELRVTANYEIGLAHLKFRVKSSQTELKFGGNSSSALMQAKPAGHPG